MSAFFGKLIARKMIISLENLLFDEKLIFEEMQLSSFTTELLISSLVFGLAL